MHRATAYLAIRLSSGDDGLLRVDSYFIASSDALTVTNTREFYVFPLKTEGSSYDSAVGRLLRSMDGHPAYKTMARVLRTRDAEQRVQLRRQTRQ